MQRSCRLIWVFSSAESRLDEKSTLSSTRCLTRLVAPHAPPQCSPLHLSHLKLYKKILEGKCFSVFSGNLSRPDRHLLALAWGNREAP